MEEFTLEFTIDEVRDLTDRVLADPDPVPPTPKGKMYVVKNVTGNQVKVISSAKARLVQELGRKRAGAYIAAMEASDNRGVQYWLRYQIERSAFPETYSLIQDALRWIALNPQPPTTD